MSIPSDSLWRGCASDFSQPLSDDDRRDAQNLVETVYYFNCRIIRPPLPDIIYRSSGDDRNTTRESDRERDIRTHVFRWDTAHYQQVFQNGFRVRRQDHTPDEVFFDLYHYVQHSGRPLDGTRFTTHAFVSTTINSGWRPPVETNEFLCYRYEIYAPGGIDVEQTLGLDYQYSGQQEICFVQGIAPQYIRSAQLFRARLLPGQRIPIWSRADNELIINENFNPQSHPQRRIVILRPVSYRIENGKREDLDIKYWPDSMKRQVSAGYDVVNWYSREVLDADNNKYINAAFRARATNEAYLFMRNEYVLVNYAPGSTNDRVINGPLLICDGYPSLIGTAFGEHGIDCAFDTHNNTEAFIFSGNLCAHIDYAPGTTNDRILKGPITIAAMFPFFKDTVFESGVDAAFRATATLEAYIFKGDRYALINYGNNRNPPRLIANRRINEGFFSFRNTIFETGIDAAFASHRRDEAYIFKGQQYALINFAPGTTNDRIIGGIKPIIPNNWPSLVPVVPRPNRGLDIHEHE
ncbi:hypothetical protein REPUB_Repub06bG0068300 [Reevesia pubescens]